MSAKSKFCLKSPAVSAATCTGVLLSSKSPHSVQRGSMHSMWKEETQLMCSSLLQLLLLEQVLRSHLAPCTLLPKERSPWERWIVHQHIRCQERQKAGLNHTGCDAGITWLTVHKLLLDSPQSLTSLLLISLFLISTLTQLYSRQDLQCWGHPADLQQQLQERPASHRKCAPVNKGQEKKTHLWRKQIPPDLSPRASWEKVCTELSKHFHSHTVRKRGARHFSQQSLIYWAKQWVLPANLWDICKAISIVCRCTGKSWPRCMTCHQLWRQGTGDKAAADQEETCWPCSISTSSHPALCHSPQTFAE